MIGQTLDATVAAQVLNHIGRGGYPAGSFVSALLVAWSRADPTNQVLLSRAYPGIGEAMRLTNEPGGIEKLQEVAAS